MKIFAPPDTRKDFFLKPGHSSATIPFQLVENLIHIPVSINNEQHYWILDSGASMSVIDYDYSHKLGLQAQGSIKGYGFGDLFELSFVEVPGYQVGPIHFNSQKMYVSKGLTARSYEPDIFGILGYDFLSRFVVEIDYDKLHLTLHTPEDFIYTGSGTTIEAPLKYRTFTLPVLLDNKYLSSWTLDLGSFQSSVHYPFANKHGLLNKPGIETISQGMSGISFERTTQFSCLQIDHFQLSRPLISIPTAKGKGATALGEVGGNIGNSTLRHFHLFLNYPEQKIILEKGTQFNEPAPRDKSGMLIGRSADNQPMISYIAENSPAQKAGLIAGDIIMEMVGESVTPGSEIVPLRLLLRRAVDSRIELKVLRSDKVINTHIILQHLFPVDNRQCKPAY